MRSRVEPARSRAVVAPVGSACPRFRSGSRPARRSLPVAARGSGAGAGRGSGVVPEEGREPGWRRAARRLGIGGCPGRRRGGASCGPGERREQGCGPRRAPRHRIGSGTRAPRPGSTSAPECGEGLRRDPRGPQGGAGSPAARDRPPGLHRRRRGRPGGGQSPRRHGGLRLREEGARAHPRRCRGPRAPGGNAGGHGRVARGAHHHARHQEGELLREGPREDRGDGGRGQRRCGRGPDEDRGPGDGPRHPQHHQEGAPEGARGPDRRPRAHGGHRGREGREGHRAEDLRECPRELPGRRASLCGAARPRSLRSPGQHARADGGGGGPLRRDPLAGARAAREGGGDGHQQGALRCASPRRRGRGRPRSCGSSRIARRRAWRRGSRRRSPIPTST